MWLIVFDNLCCVVLYVLVEWWCWWNWLCELVLIDFVVVCVLYDVGFDVWCDMLVGELSYVE